MTRFSNASRLALIVLSASLLPGLAAPAQQPVPPEPQALVSNPNNPTGTTQRNRLSIPVTPPQQPGGAYAFLYRGSLACGGGAAYSVEETRPTLGCGFGFTMLPMVVTEFGLMGPALNRHNFTAYFSADATIPITLPSAAARRLQGSPIALIGYTRLFETGRNAFDYGVGFERNVDRFHSLQFEVRDYWTFATPQQHNTMIRLVWITGLPD